MPITRLRHLFHCFVWLLAYATAAYSQGVPTATLRGTVTDDSTSSALENADVFISQTTLGSPTDKQGRFEIRNVPLGSYELVASRVGYHMRSIRVVVGQSNPEHLVVPLRPKAIELNEVAVTATEAKEWKGQLEKFKKLFFGESALGSEAKLLNPEVLDFTGGANPGFEATARMPLEIDNRALGYHLQFILTRFVVNNTNPTADGIFNDQQYLNCVGKQRFTELTPLSAEERARWDANRMLAYKGSFRHFLVSLLKNELAREGFLIGLLPQQATHSWNAGLAESISEPEILSDGAVPYEKVLQFKGTLLIKYVGKPVDAHTQLLDGSFPALDISKLRLNYESVRINSQGIVRDWSPTRLYGYWAASRVADALPLDYEPDALTAPINNIELPAPTAASASIIPLAVGNSWTIRISYWDLDGKLRTSRYETSRIVGDTIIDGERWFVMSGDGWYNLCANKVNGFYKLNSGTKVLHVKYPAKVGDSYHGPSGETKVVSLNANISVPKGSFVCYQYRVSGPEGARLDLYYSPGVGLVSIDGATPYGTLGILRTTTTGELVDFVLR